jgi:aspartate kinase
MISQSSSEQNICFVVPQDVAALVTAALHREFERELHQKHIHRISGETGIVIVTVVGIGMKGTPGIGLNVPLKIRK